MNKENSSRKKRAAALAVALVAVIAVTGTLTYTNFAQSEENKFEGGLNVGVRLHNDSIFDITPVYPDVNSTEEVKKKNNADIYVENY